jgi:hypothetical protein
VHIMIATLQGLRGDVMKLRMGSCLLQERLNDAGASSIELARELRLKPERLQDYMNNTRVMPLKTAASIAVTLRCNVLDLYEWQPEQE